MPDSKISNLTELTAPVAEDELVIVDKSDTTMSDSGTTKKVQAIEILQDLTHNATDKTTPADNDEIGLIDSAASFVLKKLTWANLKATLFSSINLTDGQGINYQLSTSIATSDLTVSLKTFAGTDPSSTDIIKFSIGNSILSLVSALSVTVTDSMGDIFGLDSGKIQGNDAQLFIYAIDNNGTLQMGVSLSPNLRTIATNYYDSAGQTGSAGYSNIVMSGTRNATNSCRVIGRINVLQNDDNTWASPTIAKIINRPIFNTDWLNFTPQLTGGGSMTISSIATKYLKYEIDNNTVFFKGSIGYELGGTPSNFISLTPPINRLITSDYGELAGNMFISLGGGGYSSGMIYEIGTGNSLFLVKYDFSNYSLGSSLYVNFSGNLIL